MAAIAYPHISTAGGGPARLERLPRIRVAQLAADHLGNGWSAEEILRQYPHLTAGEVHAALAYYYDHREEVDQIIATEIAELEASGAAPPSPLRMRLLAARKKS